MTQDPNTLVDFTVADGEQVTITVNAVDFTRAAPTDARFAGVALVKVGNQPPDVYQFIANRAGAVGAALESFYCQCTFLTADPWYAKYTFQLSGSKGGNFKAPDLVNPAESKTIEFSFEIH